MKDDGGALRREVAVTMEDHWRPEVGWTVPNPSVYPWLWLWDSCFHSLVWDSLDDPRAIEEMASVFRAQTPSGFVPHMNYGDDPDAAAGFWGKSGSSTLTQPPMYGHALAVLHRGGRDVRPLIEPALRAMHHLLDRRAAPCGLLRIFHPWESGIDDHVRWSAWQPEPWDRGLWREIKGDLVEALVIEDGEAVGSRDFDVCPASFNALVAWNARELASVAGDGDLLRRADALAGRLDRQWDASALTWVDARPDGSRASSIRTLDALLPALVTRRPPRRRAALDASLAADAFGLPFGPSSVHVAEPQFAPDSYGRGSSWPHLTYLLWVAADRFGYGDHAAALAERLHSGAVTSERAEYWNPFDGTGHGARPQAWTGLSVVADSGQGDRRRLLLAAAAQRVEVRSSRRTRRSSLPVSL